MKRIFADYAYGAEPRDGCWWDDTQDIDPNPQLRGDVRCDVVIIGAGFTGVSAALHLAQAGASVVVLEASCVGWGASGRNGGFCCLGGGMASDAAMDRRYGKPARLAWHGAEKAAVSLVDQTVRDLDLDVDRHSVGETCLAHRPSEMRRFEAEIESAVENYGVAPESVDRVDLPSHGMAGPFFGALTMPIGFGLNPRKYLAGLVNAAQAAGAQFFDQSAALAISEREVTLEFGRVSADRVILATNGYSSEDVPAELAGRYMPAQSTVLVTRPLSVTELEAQGWTSDQMAYDTRHLLHYFRLMPDRRFLFGMRGGVFASAAAERAARQSVLRDFRQMFPAWTSVEVTHSWSGMVCLARDRVPFVGPLDSAQGVLAGFAYHGNGVAMGSFAGKLLADLALGRLPEQYPDVMRAQPARFPFGAFRRLVMPPIYGALRLLDALP